MKKKNSDIADSLAVELWEFLGAEDRAGIMAGVLPVPRPPAVAMMVEGGIPAEEALAALRRAGELDTKPNAGFNFAP